MHCTCTRPPSCELMRSDQVCTLMTAVEESTMRDRQGPAGRKLLAQDAFIRDHLRPDDCIVLSLGPHPVLRLHHTLHRSPPLSPVPGSPSRPVPLDIGAHPRTASVAPLLSPSVPAHAGSLRMTLLSGRRERHRAEPDDPDGGEPSRARDCHFADTPFLSALEHLLKADGGAAS